MTTIESGGWTPPPTSVDSAIGYTTPQRTPKNELDKDAFLQLLVAQMRYQDPSSPMDTSAFMAQTTQLTSVEKLTELAGTTRSAFDMQQRLGAASLIGKQVAWTTEDGTTRSGTVSAVTVVGGTPTLRVGDQDVSLGSVTAVVAAQSSPGTGSGAPTAPTTPPATPAGGPDQTTTPAGDTPATPTTGA
ncbi:flagellar hook capping FlgD N-terminal domain-containing protein [Thalassiella azotivora]